MGIKRQIPNKRFMGIVVFFTTVLILAFQYQNCAMTSSMQHITNSSSTGTSSAICNQSGCGFIQNTYWNHCQMNVVGWAWSTVASVSKPVLLSDGAGDSCSTTTIPSISGATPIPLEPSSIITQYPFTQGQNVGYSCSFGTRSNFANSALNISASVSGYSAGSYFAPTPADCNNTQSSAPPNTCSTGGTGTAFGWMEYSQWGGATSVPTLQKPSTTPSPVQTTPAACNLIVKGWAWMVGASDTKVMITLADGTSSTVSLTSLQSGDVMQNPQVKYSGSNLSCLGATPYFYASFPNHGIPTSYTIAGSTGSVTTVSGVIYSTSLGIYQALDPIYIAVPASCILN